MKEGVGGRRGGGGGGGVWSGGGATLRERETASLNSIREDRAFKTIEYSQHRSVVTTTCPPDDAKELTVSSMHQHRRSYRGLGFNFAITSTSCLKALTCTLSCFRPGRVRAVALTPPSMMRSSFRARPNVYLAAERACHHLLSTTRSSHK